MSGKGVSPSFHQPLYVVVMPPTRLDYPRTWSEFVARFHDDEGRQTEPQDVVGSGLKGIPPSRTFLVSQLSLFSKKRRATRMTRPVRTQLGRPDETHLVHCRYRSIACRKPGGAINQS